MRFSSITGIEDVKAKLTQSGHRNHHAQIFYGPSGSANLALALAYATYINCENQQERDSCGQCPSCTKMDKLIHPDLHFIFPVSPTQKYKGKDAVSVNFITDWRELLNVHPFITLDDWISHFGGENKQVNISKEESRQIIQKLSLKSFEATFKIMLIWLPEWMHPSAANAILKVLEEPPGNTIFLMVSNDYENLLPTITSRAQLVNIRAFNTEEIEEYLHTQFDFDTNKAQHIAQLSEGSINKAIKLCAEQSPEGTNQSFIQWMRLCWQNDYEALVYLSDDFHSSSRLSQKGLITGGLELIRNALLSGNGVEKLVQASSDEKSFVKKFGESLSPGKIEKLSNDLSEAYYHIERNASAKMTFLDLSIRISRLLKS